MDSTNMNRRSVVFVGASCKWIIKKQPYLLVDFDSLPWRFGHSCCYNCLVFAVHCGSISLQQFLENNINEESPLLTC